MAEGTAKYLIQHTHELRRRLIHNEDFVRACKNLGIEDVNLLLPLRRDVEDTPTRETLLEIKNHDTWRQGVLEAIISEQMRLAEEEEDNGNETYFDLEESRRIDEEYLEKNRIFEENIEARWKEVSRKHLKQRTKAKFPGRHSYKQYKIREKQNPHRHTFFTKEMRTRKLRNNAKKIEERSKHKKEWREWEEMQTRWERTARIQYKNARLESFLAEKGRELMKKRDKIRVHDSGMSPELISRRERERKEMERKIRTKHDEASKRREEFTLRRDMELAIRNSLFDQRRDNARRHLRAKDWETNKRLSK